ncbi:dipeptidase [Daejeonella sp.]|jgi:membrane dipeptidase|uniref:dipeptidase n=1 Tax=Daejeonella sp. TaxID=2805397 RepID=UPI0027B8A131|nr:membrane dipeptidase [Daejeonella sp.]
MKSKRRDFLKYSGLAGLSLASNSVLGGLGSELDDPTKLNQKAFFSQDNLQKQFRINDQIKADFEMAKNILKPTQKQLEHGLELHKNSLVIDAYGFMPRAAYNGELLNSALNAKASSLEVQDMQEDMSMTRFVLDKKERDEFENAWEASGVTCIIQNAGEEGNDIKRLLKRLSHFTYATDMMKDFVGKAVTPDDIFKAKKENRHALYFSGNGVPLPQEWVSVEEELRYISVFFQLGIRMMHLTYNRRNVIGDGCAEKSNGGLSDFGRSVVKEMNRVGVIVDIAHSGWQTSLEAAQLSQRPMVASHSTIASVNHHIRSKPDNVIRAIADTGGYIGICCIPRFLGGTGDISSMMKHIDYVVKKFGSDHVAIGTDISYTSSFAAEESRKIIASKQGGRTRWEALWPEENFKESAEMVQSMSWTNWPLFTVGMVQMGYPDDVIQKILSGNSMRVAKAALK